MSLGFPLTPGMEGLNPMQRIALGQRMEQQARAGAANTNISQNTEKSFLGNLATGAAETVNTDYAAATAAVSALGTVNDIRQALHNAMTGPAASTEQLLTRIADRLNIGGPDAKARLAATASMLQNMAQAELTAAAAMKGQGQITEAERALIARAAAGNINMSQAEIAALIGGIEKASRWRIAKHDRNMDALKRNPNSASIVDFYQLPPIPDSSPAQGPAKTPTSIESAVEAEIRRRAGQGAR